MSKTTKKPVKKPSNSKPPKATASKTATITPLKAKSTSKPKPQTPVEPDAATIAAALADAQKVEAGTLLVSIRFERFGTRTSLNDSEYDIADGADKSRTSAYMQRLDSPPLHAIRTFDRETKRTLTGLCFPSYFREGIYRLPVGNVARFTEVAEQRATERLALVAAFAADYPEALKRTAAKMGPLFHAQKYPSAEAAAAEYAFSWQFVASGVPEGLRAIDPATYKAERTKFTQQLVDAAAQYRLLLREELTTLVKHLVERLTPNADGTAKVLRTSALGNIGSFLENLPVMNVANDTELTALGHQLDQMLAGVDLKAIKDDDALRAETAKQFAVVETTLSSLITEAKVGRRRVILAPSDSAAA